VKNALFVFGGLFQQAVQAHLFLQESLTD